VLNEPILLFVAVVNLPFGVPEIERFKRILRRLIVFEFVLGLIQIPIFLSTGNTEAITGTFYGNAEQYTGFLLIGVCFYLGMMRLEVRKRTKYRAFIIALLLLIPLVDNKASWAGVIGALYLLMSQLGGVSGKRLNYVVGFAVLIIAFITAASLSPSLVKFEGLTEAWQTGNLSNLGKIKAYRDVFAAFEQYPYMTLFGSGPGTFYSRAGQQFYVVSADIFWNPERYLTSLKGRTSNSMSGLIEPNVSLEPFYKRFYLNDKIYSVGTAQVDSPFASYAGLLGETGVIGTAIYLSFYIGIFRRLKRYCTEYRNDPNIFPLVTTSIGFLVYTAIVSLYNSWLETGRMTTILWVTIAIVCQYAERFQSDRGKAEVIDSRILSPSVYQTQHRNAAVVGGREPQRSF